MVAVDETLVVAVDETLVVAVDETLVVAVDETREELTRCSSSRAA